MCVWIWLCIIGLLCIAVTLLLVWICSLILRRKSLLLCLSLVIMSIHAISGKPGGGKSLLAVRMVLDELVLGSRVIITNLALHVDKISEYLDREYPSRVFDLHHRIRFLDDETTGQFWTFRPAREGYSWVRIPRLSDGDWKSGKKPSYAAAEDAGVMYVIDECHNFFNARAWAETGRDVLFYLSQHRKLGDTVVWITQAVANVDKQFRSVTQDYTYMTNLTKQKLGWFRLPAYFLRHTYGGPATPQSKPMESGAFKLDVSGLASLYSTAAGVGIMNRGSADVGERKKGLPLSYCVAGLFVLIVCLFKFGPHLAGYWLSKPLRDNRTLNPLPVLRRPAEASSVVQDPRGSFRLDLSNRVTMIGFESHVRPTAWNAGLPGQMVAKFPSVSTVYLSDGSEWTSGDGHLQYLCEHYCVVDGFTNWYRPVFPKAAVVAAAPAPAVMPVVLPGSVDSGQSEEIVIQDSAQHGVSHPAIRQTVGGYSAY